MSLNLNKVILAGRLTAHPELKTTINGIWVTRFTVAVNRPKQKDGTAGKADFINCVAWRNTAEFIARAFVKGSAICVTGSIRIDKWEDETKRRRYVSEVVVDEARFVEGKGAPIPPIDELLSEAVDADDTYEDISDDEMPF